MINNTDVARLVSISKNISVLYVEDDDFIRAQMTNLLADIFDDLKEAKNGKEAIEILRTDSIDIVITDVVMPVMDGLELVKNIKSEKFESKIVIMSAVEDVDLEKFEQAGVDAFVPKPIEPSRLFTILLSLCSLKSPKN